MGIKAVMEGVSDDKYPQRDKVIKRIAFIKLAMYTFTLNRIIMNSLEIYYWNENTFFFGLK